MSTRVHVFGNSPPGDVNYTDLGEYQVEDITCPACGKQNVTTAFMTPDASKYWHDGSYATCSVSTYGECPDVIGTEDQDEDETQ